MGESGVLLDGLRAPLVEAIARFKLRACTSVGPSPRVVGRVWVHGDGEVRLGGRVSFDAAAAPIELYAWEGASIVIGDDCRFEGGTSIEATRSVTIGDGARFGAFCKVMDNHFHPLLGDRHSRPEPRPVVIGQDVTLGARVIVLAGALLERGARVDAATVVKAPPGRGARESTRPGAAALPGRRP